MWVKYINLIIVFNSVELAIYPYSATQDIVYNAEKVIEVSTSIDGILKYYETTPPKDPEWFITLNLARGQLEYTINQLDKSVPNNLIEKLQMITRSMDRAINGINRTYLAYRNKDYKFVAKEIFENIALLSAMTVPIKLGYVGKRKKLNIDFNKYIEEARSKTPNRKATGLKYISTRPSITDACMMQILIAGKESQSNWADPGGSCEVTPECSAQLMVGTGLAFQQMSRLRAASLARLYDCMSDHDLTLYINNLCIKVYSETISLEAWKYPSGTRTLFIQQILYCASHGYGEFIKPYWMAKILAWQESKGCYADEWRPFLRLTGYIGPAFSSPSKYSEKESSSQVSKCNSVTSAMALGSLAVYIRALLDSDGALE